MSHRYILEPYKGPANRHLCPSCHRKEKTFSHYIDTQTGYPLAVNVGRCNRELKCGYHYTPREYFQDNKLPASKGCGIEKSKPTPTTKAPEFSTVPTELFEASLKSYNQNPFVTYLTSLLGSELTEGLIRRYRIGTSKKWGGSTVFWQVDLTGRVRTGKIMLYSPITGKRVKIPYNHITWAHKALNKPQFALRQCLFGEHLLVDPKMPVAVVESEKTAIIASAYLDQFIWLAIGSLSNLTEDRCRVLEGRNVVFFPDCGGFKRWDEKVKSFSLSGQFRVSDLLERKSSNSEKEKGLDLADYLVKSNPQYVPK